MLACMRRSADAFAAHGVRWRRRWSNGRRCPIRRRRSPCYGARVRRRSRRRAQPVGALGGRRNGPLGHERGASQSPHPRPGLRCQASFAARKLASLRQRRAAAAAAGLARRAAAAHGALASALDGALPAPLGDGAASPWALHGRGAGLWRASMHLCTMVDAARVWGREGAACAHVARVASSRIPTQERGGVSTVVCRSFPVCFCLRLAADCTTESPSQSTSELCEQAL
mmetsp:Transcript_6864/g.20009  ORF Transcript_6864/g.20009 Transcript_6864/m.20009 type:complete len:228 (+) Transcript_6864:1176-1859(+)